MVALRTASQLKPLEFLGMAKGDIDLAKVRYKMIGEQP